MPCTDLASYIAALTGFFLVPERRSLSLEDGRLSFSSGSIAMCPGPWLCIVLWRELVLRWPILRIKFGEGFELVPMKLKL